MGMNKFILIILIVAVFVGSIWANAAPKPQYSVTSSLYVDGKLISSSKAIATAGEPVELGQTLNAQNPVKFKAVATEIQNQNLMMIFDVDYNEGNEKFQLTPGLTGKLGYESESVSNVNGKKVVIKVLATKVN